MPLLIFVDNIALPGDTTEKTIDGTRNTTSPVSTEQESEGTTTEQQAEHPGTATPGTSNTERM